MRQICTIMVAVGSLAGCAMLDLAPETIATVHYGDRICGAEARQRSEDASINGFADIALRVGRDTYDQCMAEQRPVRLSMTP